MIIPDYCYPRILDHNEICLNDIDDVKYFNINPLLNPKRENAFFFTVKNSCSIKYVILNYDKEKDILEVAKNGAKYIFSLDDFYWILKSIPSENVVFKHYKNDENYYLNNLIETRHSTCGINSKNIL